MAEVLVSTTVFVFVVLVAVCTPPTTSQNH